MMGLIYHQFSTCLCKPNLMVQKAVTSYVSLPVPSNLTFKC